jgi:hypothetical protein
VAVLKGQGQYSFRIEDGIRILNSYAPAVLLADIDAGDNALTF